MVFAALVVLAIAVVFTVCCAMLRGHIEQPRQRRRRRKPWYEDEHRRTALSEEEFESLRETAEYEPGSAAADYMRQHGRNDYPY